MVLREARPDDADTLGALALAAKASWGYSTRQLDAWRGQLTLSVASIQSQPTCVLEQDGQIVGFYQLDMLSRPAELAHLWVQPRAMRQGVGRTLLAHAAEHLARAGIDTLHIDADPNALPFYLQCGARHVDDRSAPVDGQPERTRPQLRLSCARAVGPAGSQYVPMANKQELTRFLAAEFPQNKCTIDAVGAGTATVRHAIGIDELRPGGTVSGPVMMTVADLALYVAILGAIGIVPLAVTTSLNINFLRKPSADRAIIGVCTLLKLGKTLAVGEVSLYSEGFDDPVAHVVGTYAIPRQSA